jgi:hypothetical protein
VFGVFGVFGVLGVAGADQYVRVVASCNTSFLLVQFYRGLQGWSRDELISYVNSINTRAPAKKRLLEPLRASDEMRLPSPSAATQYASTVERRGLWQDLVTGTQRRGALLARLAGCGLPRWTAPRVFGPVLT